MTTDQSPTAVSRRPGALAGLWAARARAAARREGPASDGRPDSVYVRARAGFSSHYLRGALPAEYAVNHLFRRAASPLPGSAARATCLRPAGFRGRAAARQALVAPSQWRRRRSERSPAPETLRPSKKKRENLRRGRRPLQRRGDAAAPRPGLAALESVVAQAAHPLARLLGCAHGPRTPPERRYRAAGDEPPARRVADLAPRPRPSLAPQKPLAPSRPDPSLGLSLKKKKKKEPVRQGDVAALEIRGSPAARRPRFQGG